MLLGLSGKAGCGKDTVADCLVRTYGFKRYAFADAVRDVALSIDPLLMTNWEASFDNATPKLNEFRLSDAIEVHGWDKAKRTMPEVRRLLQVIGTEAGRLVLGENVWVDIIERKWFEDGTPDAVITDMRFQNEFDWIEGSIDAASATVRIERPVNPDAIVSKHVSEAYDFDCRYTIQNDGTLERLYSRVDELMVTLNG